MRWRMLKSNPAEGVELPKKTRRKMQALDEEQARKFLETAREAHTEEEDVEQQFDDMLAGLSTGPESPPANQL
jgi:site-specific recombinase XerC